MSDPVVAAETPPETPPETRVGRIVVAWPFAVKLAPKEGPVQHFVQLDGWATWVALADKMKRWTPPPTAEEMAALEKVATTDNAKRGLAELKQVLAQAVSGETKP